MRMDFDRIDFERSWILIAYRQRLLRLKTQSLIKN